MDYKNNIDEILKEGYGYLEKGLIDEAQEIYLNGLKTHPDNISLINNLAQTYAMTGDKRKSKDYHKKLIALCDKDDSPEMLMLKGNSLMSINNITDALEAYEKVLDKNPQNIPALFQISAIFQEKEDFEKSNKHLNLILLQESGNVLALINKGMNYSKMENYQKAQECYDKVLEISPRHEEATRLKGELLKQIGDEDSLKEHIKKTLEINPDSAYIIMLKAMEYANADDDKALEFFNRAIAIDPDFDEAYFNKAGYLMLKKRFDEAIECYKQAFEINPESGGIIDREGLFELLNQMKNAAKGRKYAES